METEIIEEMSQKSIILKKKLESLKEEASAIRKMLPKKTKRQTLPQSMTDEEFFKIIKSIPDKPQHKESKVAFLLAYESGLRISEIKNLKPIDIDIKAKRIFIRNAKYSKDRVVPLPKHWKTYMINYIPPKKDIRSLQRNFKDAVERCGLNPIYHFHSLRHTFALHCLERGMPINQVQLLMGHSSVATTNVYVKANPIDALSTYEEIF